MFNRRRYTGDNHDRQESRSSTENDKSHKEDYIMRLYEFADPTKYLLAEIDAAELLKLPETVRSDDKPDDSARRSRKKAEAEKLTDTL
jgi:hypothetical protein